MSGLGYGIGSFMEGLASGIRSGQAIASRNRSEALDERRLQLLEEEARRKADDDAFERDYKNKNMRLLEEQNRRADEEARRRVDTDAYNRTVSEKELKMKEQMQNAQLPGIEADRAYKQELTKHSQLVNRDYEADAPKRDLKRQSSMLKTENELKSAKTEADIRGMGEQAKAEYEGQRSKSILMSKDASGKTVYTVDGETTDSKENAEKLYEQRHGSFMDNYYNVQAPKVIDAYIASGQPEKAEQFRTFLKAEQGRKTVEIGGRIMQSYLMGDMDGVNKHINQLMRGGKYVVDDGYEVKAELLKDKDGVPAGLRGVFKDKQTGKTFSHDYAGDQLTLMVSALSDPSVLFEHGIKAAEQARAAAAEANKKGIEIGGDVTKDAYKQKFELRKQLDDINAPAWAQQMTPEQKDAYVESRFKSILGGSPPAAIGNQAGGVRPTTLMPRPMR